MSKTTYLLFDKDNVARAQLDRLIAGQLIESSNGTTNIQGKGQYEFTFAQNVRLLLYKDNMMFIKAGDRLVRHVEPKLTVAKGAQS